MSTLKVDGIRSNSASSDAITLASNGTCTANITNNLSNRNKIINGAMQIAQRGTSITTGDNATHFLMDRWSIYCQNTGSRFTITQSTDTPDGFGNSLKIDCTTADTSLASNEEVQFQQKIEGFNTQDFAKGTSSAKQYTLSFYLKTTKTGTYIVNLLGRDNTTSDVAASYTVSDTNWNRYTITFPADTTSGRGDDNDNGEALRVVWWLVAGSAVQSGDLGTTWANSSDAGRATGQVNFADSTSNDWYITGVQLEVGGVATDFEHRSFADELLRCHRYFVKQSGGSDVYVFAAKGQGSASCDVGIPLCVPMRASPTVVNTSNRFFRSTTTSQSTSTTNPSVAQFSTSTTIFSPVLALNVGGHSSTNNEAGNFTLLNQDMTFDAEL